MGVGILPNLVHLQRAQRWDRARAAQSQLSLIRSLVRAARRDVPLYRERYAGLPDVKTWADFQRLPLLTKADIKANFPDRILSNRHDARSLYPIATSGTTDRVMTFHDEYKRDWDRAADLLMGMQGEKYRPLQRRVVIPPDACYERCGADEYGRVESVRSRLAQFFQAPQGRRRAAARQVVSQFLRDYVWRLTMLKALGVDGTATPRDVLDGYLEELSRLKPAVLRALPMYLYILAKHHSPARNGSLAGVIRPAGGKLTPHMTRIIEAGLGGHVREEFGTAELGTVAYDCARTRQQHLISELIHIEFLRGGRPVAPGEPGEMVITDLRNHAAPLIRYVLGDIATHVAEPCPCGRQGLLFTVHGRLDETIVTANGRAVAGDAVIDFFLSRPGVAFARVVEQGDGRFLLEAVPESEEAGLPDAAALSEAFSAFLGSPAQVQVRAVRRIAPERSGKYRLVLSRSFEKFHASESVHDVATRIERGGRPVAVSP